MASHSTLLIVLMVIHLIVFIANLIFGLFSMGDLFGIKPGFIQPIYNISNVRFIEITPAAPTFAIWGVIYIWHVLWIIYAFVNICRQTSAGPVYTNPILLTPTFFAVSIFNWLCIITWTIIYTNYVWGAFVALFLTYVSTYVCMGLSYKALAENYNHLVSTNRSREIWLVRILVQNGLGVYATWCTLATLLTMASALSYDYPLMDQEKSSTIALSILTAELVVFVLLDLTVLDKYSRYTLTPYGVVIVTLIGILANGWDTRKTNYIFCVVLLGVSCVCTVLKAVLVGYRHNQDRRKGENFPPTEITRLKQ